MLSFKDFINAEKQNVNTLAITDAKAISTKIGTEISLARSIGGLSISDSDTTKLSENILEIAQSDEFLGVLSTEIGEPKSNESEDDFVSRAKATMTKLLLSKIGN